jgi:hypothetical protein
LAWGKDDSGSYGRNRSALAIDQAKDECNYRASKSKRRGVSLVQRKWSDIPVCFYRIEKT